MAYIPYNPNPNGWNTGDCVIRALSIATGYDWERIYIELCIQGFMMGQLPSTNSVWGAYLRGRNFSRHVIPNSCPDCYTVRDFCYDHPKGLYLLCTGGNDGTQKWLLISQKRCDLIYDLSNYLDRPKCSCC